MTQKQAAYPHGFSPQIVELVKAGCSHAQSAREFGFHATSIGTWMCQSQGEARAGKPQANCDI